MSDYKSKRLNKLAKKFNVSIDRVLSFLDEKGLDGMSASSKVSQDVYLDLLGEFQPDLKAKLAADLSAKAREEEREEQLKLEEERATEKAATQKAFNEEKEKNSSEEKVLSTEKVKVIGRVDINSKKKKDSEPPKDGPKTEEVKVEEKKEVSEVIKAKKQTLSGPKLTGVKIDLTRLVPKKKTPSNSPKTTVDSKKKRKRIVGKVNPSKFVKKKFSKKKAPVEISPEEAQKRVRETLAKLQGRGKKTSVKNRRDKRQASTNSAFLSYTEFPTHQLLLDFLQKNGFL